MPQSRECYGLCQFGACIVKCRLKIAYNLPPVNKSPQVDSCQQRSNTVELISLVEVLTKYSAEWLPVIHSTF